MGDYLFTGNGQSMLWLDVSHPESPTVVWDTVLLISPGKKVIRDSIGYVLSPIELVIVDFRIPLRPRILSRLPIPFNYYTDIAVGGSLAFVKGFQWYSYCIDVSDPGAPFIRSIVPPLTQWGRLTVTGNNLYVADQGCCPVYHVDVTNPDNVILTPLWTQLPWVVWSLHAQDTLLFLGTSRLGIYSIRVPNAPVLLSQIETGLGGVSSIAIQGTKAFLGTRNGPVLSVDISNPSSPVVLGTYVPPETATDLYAWSMAVRDTVLHASWGYGLRTLSVANPASMNELSFFPTGYENKRVVVRNGLAYVTSGYGGLWVADVSNPARPRTVGHFPTSGYAYDLVVDSSVAFISLNDPQYLGINEGWNGVWTVDIGDPTLPKLLDTFAVDHAYAISKSGSLLFVTHGNDVLPPEGVIDTTVTIVDVGDPSQVSQVGQIIAGLNVRSISTNDSIAFVATASGFGNPNPGLKIYDCRSPSTPQLLSTVLRRAEGLSLEGNRAFVHRGDSTFVIDISNLSSPQILGRVKHPPPGYEGPWQSIARNSRVFWANSGEIGVIDVSNPSVPRILLETEIGSGGIDVLGDTLYVSGVTYLGIYRHHLGPLLVEEAEDPVPMRFRLFPNYPNPFNPNTSIAFEIGGDHHQLNRVRLTVHDLLGRVVATLVDEMKSSGIYSVPFDGSGLPSGVYFYRLSVENVQIERKMLMVK
jgi:hypothetical protein